MKETSNTFNTYDQLSLLLVRFGLTMLNNNDSSCGDESCSGHGECYNGTCICEIQYEGTKCHAPNFAYYATFASIFFVLSFVCLLQLMMCVISEWRRTKKKSFFNACRPTTQKVLYFVVFLASLIRSVYFFISSSTYKIVWSKSLDSTYYPLITSGFSCIVCYWAEKFHLKDVCTDKPRFLSKSYLAFVVFNVFCFSLLAMELTTAIIYEQKDQNYYTQIFNGSFAFLLFVVLIFFLIYGIEVFFKVQGSFIIDEETEEKYPLRLQQTTINTSQLHQSRLGLLSQSFMLFVFVSFLLSKTLSEFWRSKVPLYSRNWHDVVLRIIEVGIISWFPCVLWNCIYPEQLWILNPRRLLNSSIFIKRRNNKEIEMNEKSTLTLEEEEEEEEEKISNDCWICYDGNRHDAGPIIKPCRCIGDVASVHHNCLRFWLVASSTNAENLACKVCGTRYNVEQSFIRLFDWPNNLKYWVQVIAIVSTMCVSFATTWIIIQLVEDHYAKILATASTVLIIYICIKFLSMNTVVACQKAKISTLNIVSTEIDAVTQSSTISQNP